ncbi:MAG TPA: hypothetical protein VMW69_15125 [Spirochaetia bacterium]|nr:hypothetical protein [Spirochaetia bacterium]
MKRAAFLLPLLLLPLFASGESFSGWRTATTEHFVFVFEPRDAAAVAQLRTFAEQVYSEVTGLLESRPSKIWVVVNGRVDTANGAFASLPARLILYVTSPSVPVLGFKEHEYLRMLFTHELTHYVHLNYDKGLFWILSKVFGPGLTTGDEAFLPGWMIEGITTNTETIFTDGGRGRDPYFELIYKALTLDNSFFSLDQAGYGSDFPPRERIYVAGYLMVHYLLDHFGEKSFTEIHRQYVKFPFLGPWAAIKRVTGQSAEEIYRLVLHDLRQKYSKYKTISPGTLISPKGIGSYYLPVITARAWYEYRTTLDSGPAIVRYDPATKRESVLLDTLLTDETSLTATADGSRIVFSTFDVTPGPAGTEYTADLFSLNPESHATRRITHSAHLWQPALSPDGHLLVAVQRQGSYSRLVLVNQSSGKVTPLFSEPQTNVYNPVFSPNAALIAFTINDHGSQRIATMRLADARPAPPDSTAVNAGLAHPLPREPHANLYFPRFVGNDHLVFTADLGDGLSLYESDLAKGGLLKIAEDPVGVASALVDQGRVIYSTYSPDGYVIRERPIHPIEVADPAAAPRAASSGSSSSAAIGPASGGRTDAEANLGPTGRYTDWPRPLYWLPVPVYAYLPSSTGNIPFGFGIYSIWGSLLGDNLLGGFLTFRTDIFQPSLVLNLQSMIGRSLLSYSMNEGYSAGTSYSQTLAQSLGYNVPIVARYLMDTTTSLSITPGLSDTLRISAAQAFSLADPFRAPQSFAFQHAYSLNLDLSFSRDHAGGPKDLYPREHVEASLQEQYYPSLLSESTPGLVSIFEGTVSIPSFIPHQVVRFGAKSSYSTVVGTRSPLVNPRGIFIPGSIPTPVDQQATPGRSVLGFDYLSTMALADSPLPLGFNFQGLAAGFHIEAAADWGSSSEPFTPDPYLYAGIELLSFVGYYGDGGALPIGLGVAARFDPTGRHTFDPLHDIGPYVFIGTDSFLGSVTNLIGALSAGLKQGRSASQPEARF